MPVPETKLREMLAGCVGVTPGPWEADYGGTMGHIKSLSPTKAPSTPTFARMLSSDEVLSISEAESVRTRYHIARLDPQTVASIITELLSHRKAHTGREDNNG